MSNLEYEQWWSLHLRVAKGETLSPQEESDYATGLSQLDGETAATNGETVNYLRTLRTAINRAVSLHTELTARSADLDRKILALEARYQQQTGQTLNWEPHAPA